MNQEEQDILREAFHLFVFYGNGIYQQEIEDFSQRWGGIDVSILQRVVQEGQKDDVTVALFALGLAPITAISKTLLHSFLSCVYNPHRWASALSLTRIHDPFVLPTLHTLLIDDLAKRSWFYEDRGVDEESDQWDDLQRERIAFLLAEWKQDEITRLLRQAVQTTWTVEQRFFSSGRLWEASEVQTWYSSQDVLLYALGGHTAFDVLAHVSFPLPQTYFIMATMCAGDVRVPREDLPFCMWADKKQLASAVKRSLKEHFGLGEQEQQDCLEMSMQHYMERPLGPLNKQAEREDDQSDRVVSAPRLIGHLLAVGYLSDQAAKEIIAVQGAVVSLLGYPSVKLVSLPNTTFEQAETGKAMQIRTEEKLLIWCARHSLPWLTSVEQTWLENAEEASLEGGKEIKGDEESFLLVVGRISEQVVQDVESVNGYVIYLYGDPRIVLVSLPNATFEETDNVSMVQIRTQEKLLLWHGQDCRPWLTSVEQTSLESEHEPATGPEEPYGMDLMILDEHPF